MGLQAAQLYSHVYGCIVNITVREAVYGPSNNLCVHNLLPCVCGICSRKNITFADMHM
jgi:hypothetical protein